MQRHKNESYLTTGNCGEIMTQSSFYIISYYAYCSKSDFKNNLFLELIQYLELQPKGIIHKVSNKWINKSEISLYAPGGMLQQSRNQ